MSSTGRFCHAPLTSAIVARSVTYEMRGPASRSRWRMQDYPPLGSQWRIVCQRPSSGGRFSSARPRGGRGVVGRHGGWGVIGSLSLTLPKRGVGQSVVSGCPTSLIYISPVVLLCVDALDNSGFSNNKIPELQHSKISRYRTYASPLSVTSRDRSTDRSIIVPPILSRM
jgi:hypothetical protein